MDEPPARIAVVIAERARRKRGLLGRQASPSPPSASRDGASLGRARPRGARRKRPIGEAARPLLPCALPQPAQRASSAPLSMSPHLPTVRARILEGDAPSPS